MSGNNAPVPRGEGSAPSGLTGANLLHPVDTVIAAILLALCGWLYYETTLFEEMSFLFVDNMPPAFFPVTVLASIAVLAILLPFEHILLKKQGKNIDKDRSGRVLPKTWVTMAALTGVVLLTPVLGVTLTLVAICIVLPWLWGERRLHLMVPFAIGFPALVAVLFNVVLGVYFDPGMIGFSFR